MKLKRTVLQIVHWIVAGAYTELEQFTHGLDMSATIIQREIEDWPYKLLIPPEEQLDVLINIITFPGIPKSWQVECDCWTAEEGRSSLTLIMEFTESNDDLYSVVLQDIHVM